MVDIFSVCAEPGSLNAVLVDKVLRRGRQTFLHLLRTSTNIRIVNDVQSGF